MPWSADPSSGYWVRFGLEQTVHEPEFKHVLCGPHAVKGAWCVVCKKPLLRYLALDTRDPRIALQGLPTNTLSLFYCWPCQSGTIEYRVAGDDAIELLMHDTAGYADGFPYANYPDYFPGTPVELVRVSDEEQRILKDINRDVVPDYNHTKGPYALGICQHQIGGEPYLVQEDTEYEIPCPSCGQAMPFFASMGNANPDPRGFTDEPFVQVIYHLCRACGIISCFNQAD